MTQLAFLNSDLAACRLASCRSGSDYLRRPVVFRGRGDERRVGGLDNRGRASRARLIADVAGSRRRFAETRSEIYTKALGQLEAGAKHRQEIAALDQEIREAPDAQARLETQLAALEDSAPAFSARHGERVA